MSPFCHYEIGKSCMGNLLEIYFLEEEKSGGTEPDKAYCIGADKEFPDLVIEVILARQF